MGNEEIGYDTAGDLILVVSLSPHFLFRRDGNDLLHTVEITLQQALTGSWLDFEVPSLDAQRPVKVEMGDEVVLDGDMHIVPHRGLPHLTSDGQVCCPSLVQLTTVFSSTNYCSDLTSDGQLHYGDMQIEFRVLMPRGPLSPEKKVELFEALEGLEWRSPNPRS
jgi:DnaJ-class molecular chaperone